MKIILSRKGFDSGAGGMPSPILPDGTLLSMPIPERDMISYDSLFFRGKSYSTILQELNPDFQETHCHLDPDIREGCKSREEHWVAVFGQAGSALTHLKNNGVGVGDIFLFFGWFRQTEYAEDGTLRFVKKAPDLHIIYGYLQIGEIRESYDTIKEMYWHPHADPRRSQQSLNAIYLPSETLLDLPLRGYGTLNYSRELILTKQGHPRSHWDLPPFLLSKKISYHDERNRKADYFQSAMRGQEFVIDADDDVLDWVRRLVKP